MDTVRHEQTTNRKPSKRVQKLKRKILILRIEEVILLLIIAALVLTRCKDASERTAGMQTFSDKQIQQEYAWLEEHRQMYPEGKVEASAGNPGLIHFLYAYGNESYDKDATPALTAREKKADIPLLMQWDERWGYNSYGDNNIGICGCAPTCLAMVAEGLTRDGNITPSTVAQYAMDNGFYLYGTGTTWTVFQSYASSCNLNCTDLGQNLTSIYGELEQGHPVICSMGPGTFTTGGHFIVLSGIEDGQVIVNDPNNVEFSSRSWNLNDITNEVKNAWSFSQA
ncbi:MAG: C39 family peptidase [Lachnospiraceae bacterium]|nr:C39 family peptidase [Lachnospiraceae bacterium]